MEKESWTPLDVQKLFGEKSVSKAALLAAEREGRIPMAGRTARGKVKVRTWALSQLPVIGKRYGFLKPPTFRVVICVHTPKGGVLKTTVSLNLARMLALNGIDVVVMGVDSQCSISNAILNPLARVQSLSDLTDEYPGLFEFSKQMISGSKGKPDINDYLVATSLPTLRVLPENSSLDNLEGQLWGMDRREYFLADNVVPLLSDAEVIIIDTGFGRSQLTRNALTAANVVITPLGCEPGAYQAVDNNLTSMIDFKNGMKIKWRKHILIPTLEDATLLSSEIKNSYANSYSNKTVWPDIDITSRSIRRASQGADSFSRGTSAQEDAYNSMLAQDYRQVIEEVWHKITEGKEHEIGT